MQEVYLYSTADFAFALMAVYLLSRHSKFLTGCVWISSSYELARTL